MANKAGQIIRFATLGAYESVEGEGCVMCVAYSAYTITPLCRAISKYTNCEGIHWKELDSSTKQAPAPIAAKAPIGYPDAVVPLSEQARKMVIDTVNSAPSAKLDTAGRQYYVPNGSFTAFNPLECSIYTLYFQHIQSDASLHIECPSISVAQDLWDLLANHPSFKLQCLRP